MSSQVREIAAGGMDPETTQRVAPVITALQSDAVYRHVVAVVVCGSAGRGENRTHTRRGGSDIDLMVITHSRSPLVGRRIGRVLREVGDPGCEGGQVPLATLRVHRTLLNYEARCNGTVVAGDAGVLKFIPMESPADIPRWEAVRLLFNRMFEHIKLDAGRTDEQTCVAKSYEAIGEARMVMERRYRPSFAERWQEARKRPFSGAIPNLQERYLQTAGWRVGDEGELTAPVETARDDLLATLRETLVEYTGASGEIRANLETVSRRERHLSHRLYWTARSAIRRERFLRYARSDPSLVIWQDGLDYLTKRVNDDPAALASRWQTCPQILLPRMFP